MNFKIAATALVTAMFGTGAMAANITNLEDEPFTVIVIVGEERHEFTIPPTQSLDLGDVCANGCSVVLPNGQDYQLSAGDIASIEAGDLKLSPPDQSSGGMATEKEDVEAL